MASACASRTAAENGSATANREPAGKAIVMHLSKFDLFGAVVDLRDSVSELRPFAVVTQ
jgi:hypothetical protein